MRTGLQLIAIAKRKSKFVTVESINNRNCSRHEVLPKRIVFESSYSREKREPLGDFFEGQKNS